MAQIDTLKALLREAGCQVEDCGKPRGEVKLYVIHRPGKPSLPVHITDMGEDGYNLYVIAPGLKIEADVALILETE